MITSHVTQAAFRQGDNLYAPPSWRSEDEPTDGFMYLHAPRHMARHDPELAEAVHLITEHSDLGYIVLGRAKKGHIKFVRKDLGLYTAGSSKNELVNLNHNINLDDVIVTLPHEIMHWLQQDKNAPRNYNIRSRFLSNLTAEAGAEVCAAQVLNELWFNGIESPLKNVLNNPIWIKYKGIYKDFDDASYRAHMIGARDPMLIAGDTAFYSYFNQTSLVESYAKDTLVEHFRELNKGMSSMAQRTFNARDVESNTHVGNGYYLIQCPAVLPDLDKHFFSRMPLMRHAFGYAALQHITAVHGYASNSRERIYNENILRNNGNPFLELNVPTIMAQYDHKANLTQMPNILDVMQQLASYERV